MNQSNKPGNSFPNSEWLQQTLKLGFESLEQGRITAAQESVRQLLTAKPDLVEGHYLAGLIARQIKDRRIAVDAFGTVTKLDPGHPAAHAHMAQILMMLGQPNLGMNALKLAVRYEAGNPDVQNLIGNVYFRLGEQNAAFDWYLKAVSGRPDNPQYIIDYANSLIFLGKQKQADTEIMKALHLQPTNPQAHWILSSVRKARTADHIEEMKELAKPGDLHPQAAAFFFYAMGKEMEDLERWDEAFEAFSRGAAERRGLVDYDETAEVEMFQTLEDVYTPEWLEGQAPGLDDPSPIFIVGQPRTGTTLVERVITSHSQVHSAGELRHFEISTRRLADFRKPKKHSAELARRAAELDGAELARLYFTASKIMRGDLPRFVDKMPLNFQYIPLILSAFPRAKIIHLVRNPMDACFSSFKHLFADAYLHSYEQREMARHHARYLRLMSVWRERFPGRFFDIAYEDIARNLEPNARALIDYLELSWEDACLHFHDQDTAVTTASAVQVREPAHTRSVDRWKKYRRQLQPMREELMKHGVSLEKET